MTLYSSNQSLLLLTMSSISSGAQVLGIQTPILYIVPLTIFSVSTIVLSVSLCKSISFALNLGSILISSFRIWSFIMSSLLGYGRMIFIKQYRPLITVSLCSVSGLLTLRHSSYSPKSERTPSAKPEGGKLPIESNTRMTFKCLIKWKFKSRNKLLNCLEERKKSIKRYNYQTIRSYL